MLAPAPMPAKQARGWIPFLILRIAPAALASSLLRLGKQLEQPKEARQEDKVAD